MTDINLPNGSNLYVVNPSTGRTRPLLDHNIAKSPKGVAVDDTRGYCYWTDAQYTHDDGHNIYRYDMYTGINTLLKHVSYGKLLVLPFYDSFHINMVTPVYLNTAVWRFTRIEFIAGGAPGAGGAAKCGHA